MFFDTTFQPTGPGIPQPVSRHNQRPSSPNLEELAAVIDTYFVQKPKNMSLMKQYPVLAPSISLHPQSSPFSFMLRSYEVKFTEGFHHQRKALWSEGWMTATVFDDKLRLETGPIQAFGTSILWHLAHASGLVAHCSSLMSFEMKG